MLKRRIKQYFSNQTKRPEPITAVIVVLLVAGIGTALILGSHAASPYASVDANTGTLAGGAVAQADSTASDGTKVIFNGTGGGTGGTTANCLQLQSGSSIYPVYSALDACGYPSPDTAGVPSGTTLTTVSNTAANFYAPNTDWNGSEFSISGPTTISDLYIPGYVTFSSSAGAVTIQDTKIQYDNTQSGVVNNGQGDANVTIKYSQISGSAPGSSQCTASPPPSYGIWSEGANVVLDHDYVDCAVEPVNGIGFTLTNSYVIVDGTTVPSDHVEDVYLAGGYASGVATVKDDTLLNPQTMDDGSVAGIFGDAKYYGAFKSLTVENNLIGDWGNNGAVAIGCASDGGNDGMGYNMDTVITGNRFASAYNPSGFEAGDTDGGPGTTWSGNYMDNNPSTIVSQPVQEC